MTDGQIKAALTDQQTLALTLWAEARGEGEAGLAAVACVIRNRARNPGWWGRSIKEVCLKPGQFSCWNPGSDQNHQKLMRRAERLLAGVPILDRLFQEIEVLAAGVVADIVDDCVKGCDHYYSPAGMVPANRVPTWALHPKTKAPLTPTLVVGQQRFYKLGLDGKAG